MVKINAMSKRETELFVNKLFRTSFGEVDKRIDILFREIEELRDTIKAHIKKDKLK